MIVTRDDLKRVVRAAVRDAPAEDGYTRLSAGALRAAGENAVDRLLTEPALLAEAARYGEDARLCAPDRGTRADAVFETLFLNRSPVSEAAAGALLAIRRIGVDIGERNLHQARLMAAEMPCATRLMEALDRAGLVSVAVRVDVLDTDTLPPDTLDDRLCAALCVDALADPDAAWPLLLEKGCKDARDVRALIESRARALRAGSLLANRGFSGALWEACAGAAQAQGIPLVRADTLCIGLPDEAALRAAIAREGLFPRPFCSGAAVAEALPAFWDQARGTLARALTDAYTPLLRMGWRLSDGEIAHDVESVLAPGYFDKRYR
ncbi:hypothetical protein FACS1894196_0610 [Clostridia bacterium]|nr:hypothetical protein FACS1894196_0610 [Clostridia bacterium]